MNNGNWERNGKSCTPEFHLLMFFHLIFTVSYFPLWMCNSQKLESGLTLQVFRWWCPLCGKFLTDGKHRRYEQEMCACSCGYAHCWSLPGEDEGTGKWQFGPQIVLYPIWIWFCFVFWSVGWVCWFFYHSSCKLRLAVLSSDLRKHLTKILYSFFCVLRCCPNIATIQQVKIKKWQ